MVGHAKAPQSSGSGPQAAGHGPEKLSRVERRAQLLGAAQVVFVAKAVTAPAAWMRLPRWPKRANRCCTSTFCPSKERV